jgi:putative addiction module component (TIGR02574 family)
MTVSLESLGLDHLSRDEKLTLAGQLWDSVLASESPGALLSDAQREELQRRVADAKAHPEDYVDWEEALANTLRRLSQ